MQITYSQGYKYQLEKDFITEVDLFGESITSPFLELRPDGYLLIRKGYAWDGPSGPAIDTKSFMRGALVHDALYQMMREYGLNRDYRPTADKIMKQFFKFLFASMLGFILGVVVLFFLFIFIVL